MSFIDIASASGAVGGMLHSSSSVRDMSRPDLSSHERIVIGGILLVGGFYAIKTKRIVPVVVAGVISGGVFLLFEYVYNSSHQERGLTRSYENAK